MEIIDPHKHKVTQAKCDHFCPIIEMGVDCCGNGGAVCKSHRGVISSQGQSCTYPVYFVQQNGKLRVEGFTTDNVTYFPTTDTIALISFLRSLV